MPFKQLLDKVKKKGEEPKVVVCLPVIEEEEGIDPRTIAAIMAAVAVCEGKSISQLSFNAIRRNSNAWSAGGTEEIISTRQLYL